MKNPLHRLHNEAAADRNNSAMQLDALMADYWFARLATACKQAYIDTACLGIINRGLSVSASYSDSTVLENTSPTLHPAFCVAKLFTATLVSLLVMQGKLQFDDEITGLLPAPHPADVARNMLDGITVAQLLAHTHGLGSINLEAAPVTLDGFIDYGQVMFLLQNSRRIFAPGKFYSYGMAGYIVLGSIIEHVTQETYSHVLHKKILQPLATHDTRPPALRTGISSQPICPSSGRGLHLALRDLVTFAGSFLTPQAGVLNLTDTLLANIFATRKFMPGWSPTISGSCYGWKNFGNNWHGQNGIDKEHLTYVRINRASGTAICLCAQSDKRKPAALPSLLLQQAFPELTYNSTRQPCMLADAPPDSVAAVVGTYGNCLLRFLVSIKNSRLVLEISSTHEGMPGISHCCYLYPAEENIHFLGKPWQNITFLQLVTDNNSMRYLWDHTQLWPELTDCLFLT